LFRTFAPPSDPACRPAGLELGLFDAIAPTPRVDRPPKPEDLRSGTRLAPPLPLGECELALFRTLRGAGSCPPGSNWLCLVPFDPVGGWGRAKLGLFRAILPPEDAICQPVGLNWVCLAQLYPRVGWGWPHQSPFFRNWLCFARWVHSRVLLQTSNFTPQTIPIYTRPPNNRRVA